MLPENFQISWDLSSVGTIRSGLDGDLFAHFCLLKFDSREHGQNLLPVFPRNVHMYTLVFVYLGVCIGTDDGAQEVVKEILEDVVTSVVKGKNQ